jgi:hypothetical protein
VYTNSLVSGGQSPFWPVRSGGCDCPPPRGTTWHGGSPLYHTHTVSGESVLGESRARYRRTIGITISETVRYEGSIITTATSQAERSWVRIPVRYLNIIKFHNPSGRIRPCR